MFGTPKRLLGRFAYAVCVIASMATIGLMACGGGSSKSTKAAENGRIYVLNATDIPFDVTYLTPDFVPVKATVAPGEHKEVSEEFDAGTKITVTLTSQEAVGYEGDPSGRIKPSVDVDVTINGNMTIRITGLRFGGSKSIEYEIMSGT